MVPLTTICPSPLQHLEPSPWQPQFNTKQSKLVSSSHCWSHCMGDSEASPRTQRNLPSEEVTPAAPIEIVCPMTTRQLYIGSRGCNAFVISVADPEISILLDSILRYNHGFRASLQRATRRRRERQGTHPLGCRSLLTSLSRWRRAWAR